MKIQRQPTADEVDQIERAQKERNSDLMPNLIVPVTPLSVSRWLCTTAEVDTVEKSAIFLDLYRKLKEIPNDATTISFENEEYSTLRKELMAKAPKTWGFLAPLVVAAFEELTDPTE